MEINMCRRIDLSLDKLFVMRLKLQVRNAQPHDIVSMLQEAVQRIKPADLRGHDQRLPRNLPLLALRVARLRKMPMRPRLPAPLDLNLADAFRDPLRRLRFARLEIDFRGGLRQQRLRDMAVQRLDLRLALEAENHRAIRFPALSDRRRQLWQPLQAGQLVKDEPRLALVCRSIVHRAQHEQVKP
jgi:hypothetical protein